MTAPELKESRWVHGPPGTAGGVSVAWLEVGALVRVRVAAWGHDERLWAHWAVPSAGGTPRLDAARPFDPGRRAGRSEEPAGIRRGGAAPGDQAAVDAAARLLADWRPVLHRHRLLELVSRPGEPLDQFRRRCLSLVGPALRSGQLRGADAQAGVSQLAAEIETITLGPAELSAESLQVRVAWYPADDPPTTAVADLLLSGAARAGR